MIFALYMMFSKSSGLVINGKVDLSDINFTQNKLINLGGQWEFYWDRLLTPEEFTLKHKPQMNSLMKVPGTWDDRGAGTHVYPHRGVATYRLHLKYPSTLKDPALHIQSVATAYKLYANGKLIAEVGKVSDKLSDFKDDEESLILDLPKDSQEIELIFQVGNLNYARGGLRESPVLGSKQAFMQQKMILLALQLFFIGSVFMFAIYYFFLFMLQRKNKTALLFSMLCFITALRSLIWGEAPLLIFLPNASFNLRLYINYFTGYNFMPIMILFVLSIYPLEYKKRILGLVLLPSLFFEGLLMTSPEFMSLFTNYLYVVILLQMIYILSVMVKAVLHRRDNAIVMFITMGIFILAINQDLLKYNALSGINLSNVFLYGNFVVIMAMSFVQARQQANTHQKLVLYNENIIEADRLKDKIMETEMSFLQAQIKPHFLYNALDAIANVCEKNGKQGSSLILDLAIYLRRSLQFNSLDKKGKIETEIEFVDTYFNIEQARFGEKIQLIKEIEIPLDYQIPILIIQPIVENAVRHGISKKSEGGTVYLRMKSTTDAIYIEIVDDGVGMDEEKCESLLRDDGIKQSVGLLNIHYRLLKFYGIGLEIKSRVGHGTSVKIVIPEGEKQL